jgi:hypothetical protein
MKNFAILFVLFAIGCASVNAPIAPESSMAKPQNTVSVSIRLIHYSHITYIYQHEVRDCWTDTILYFKPDSLHIIWYHGDITIDRITRCFVSSDTSFSFSDTAHEYPQYEGRERRLP